MRTIRILPSSVSDSAELEFAYDRELIGVVRALRTRRWHAGRRRWILARDELDTLVAELRRMDVRLDASGLGAHDDAPTNISSATSPLEDTLPSPQSQVSSEPSRTDAPLASGDGPS